MKLTRPTINDEGTSPEELLRDYLHAAHAIQQAIKAVENVEFQSYDYFGPEWVDACEERVKRLAALRESRSAFMMLAMHAQEYIK